MAEFEQDTAIVTRPAPPDSPIFDILLAEVAAQRGDYQAAYRTYLEQAQSHRDPRLAERATHLGIFGQDYAQALAAAQLWQELEPGNFVIDRFLANLLLRNGEPEAGLQHLVRFLEGAPDLATAYREVTGLLVRLPDKSVALAAAAGLVARYPAVAEAHFTHGVIARAAADLELASQALRRALELRPEWPQARINLAQVMVALEQDAAALEVLAEGLAAQPRERDIRLTYARLLMRVGRNAEARLQFEKLASLYPGDPDVLYALALLALDAREDVEAERYLTALLQVGQRADEARYFLGRLEAQRGNHARALAWFGQVSAGEYRDEARIQSAVVLADQGRIDEALQGLDALRELQPELNVRLVLVAGELLSRGEQQARAMALYDAALAETPDSDDLLFARAMLAEKLDRLDLLEQDLKAVLARDPDNATALNALGYTLADRTERYAEALDYIRRALELRPDDAAIIDSMGWVQYRLGNHELALNYLQDAYARNPDAEIAAHLGEVLWITGNRERARDVLRKAWEKDRENAVLKRVMQRFIP